MDRSAALADALPALLPRLAACTVVVLGDMVADEYIEGVPARLSREAPIPILEFTRRYVVPGGATNLALNARALGAQVAVVGVVGDDRVGADLKANLIDSGIAIDGLLIDPSRPTSTKTRIIGGSTQVVPQQVARIDRVDRTPVARDVETRMLAIVSRLLPQATALIISDYENGVITPAVLDAVLPMARGYGLMTIVDSHGDLLRFKGVTAATPNQPEAEATLHRRLLTEDDLEEGARDLLYGMQADAVLITRGAEGMALIERGGTFHRIPVATLSEVRDATGAGDTVAAAFTLALAAGGSIIEAAHLGNLAAGVVVRKLGAATVSIDELRIAIERWATGTV